MIQKQELYNLCQSFVNKRLQTIEFIISSNQKALASETKSSAGDKHETGRAMLQLEIEKAGQQLQAVIQMKETLAKIDVRKKTKIAHLGSVVISNQANYFLSISAGKITVENINYFAISIYSPIGKLFLGKKKGTEISFNNLNILIKEIL